MPKVRKREREGELLRKRKEKKRDLYKRKRKRRGRLNGNQHGDEERFYKVYQKFRLILGKK